MNGEGFFLLFFFSTGTCLFESRGRGKQPAQRDYKSIECDKSGAQLSLTLLVLSQLQSRSLLRLKDAPRFVFDSSVCFPTTSKALS